MSFEHHSGDSNNNDEYKTKIKSIFCPYLFSVLMIFIISLNLLLFLHNGVEEVTK